MLVAILVMYICVKVVIPGNFSTHANFSISIYVFGFVLDIYLIKILI